MLRKILKWTGIVILVLVAGVTIATAMRQHLTYDAPLPAVKASTDSAVIARGRHLVLSAAHCADCHSPVRNVDSVLKLGQDPPLSGAFKFQFALGTFYSRNITSDSATGIGRYSDAQIARALRHGVRSDGEVLLPFMPYQHLSDEDLSAIISYLRSTKPVRNEVPQNEYSVMGKVIKAFLLKPDGPKEEIPKAVKPDTTAAYGRYLVMSVANCGGCHTKRDNTGQPAGELLAGGNPFVEEGLPTLTPPNLTPDPASGRIYSWNQDDFIKRFRMGRAFKHSHMPWESYNRMTDEELKAIYKFLRSVKPVNTSQPAKKA
ncbi:MAG TPA: cytochrome c [Flavisolibacter sp.]|jgi:mono/diheme cytochrome c family protein|nr:cytochrome c [Flavisolibacter sp.]